MGRRMLTSGGPFQKGGEGRPRVPATPTSAWSVRPSPVAATTTPASRQLCGIARSNEPLLLIAAREDVPCMGINDIVRPAACRQWVRQIVIDMPAVLRRGELSLQL